MTTRSFKIAKWFVVANYLAIVFSFIFALLFLYQAVITWSHTAYVTAFFFTLAAVGWVVGCTYSIGILPRFRETVHVSEQQIIHELADGTSIAISWSEDFKIKNRPVLGRLELVSQDGLRTVKLEHQLSGYQELLGFIDAKLKLRQEAN